MHKITFLLFISAFLFGCTAPKNTITQVSTIDALLVGAYDGQMTSKDLLRHGNFGIGTFDHLDGEMIILDGVVYQAKSSGEIATPPLSITTPFASVVEFDADGETEIPRNTGFNAFEALIDSTAPNKNVFCAIRADGTFSRMKVRAIPAQKKPYPPLTEAAKIQPVFNYKDIKGTIVGFRCPAYVKGINVPDYHLHFISDDRSKGGHILDFSCESGSTAFDYCNRFYMVLPKDTNGFDQLDLTKDRSKALHAVEKQTDQ